MGTYPFVVTTLVRMQAKFGKTMKKAMSHKMELHTKAQSAGFRFIRGWSHAATNHQLLQNMVHMLPSRVDALDGPSVVH